MSKRIIFSEEEKKDINNTGRTVLVIGPTSDGKSRLIQTIHPKETGGYGLNEIFDADVTREKIRLKDKDGNVMFPNDYLRKAKKWVMKFESASKQKQDREAVENATTISKTSIRHKKTSQKTQDSFLDTDILELGGDVFAKGDTFNEQDIVTLFKTGGMEKIQEKEVRLAQSDEELIEMGKRKTREIFDELNYVMRFESNYGNRNLREIARILTSKGGHDTPAMAVHQAADIKSLVEHTLTKLSPIVDVLKKKDINEPKIIVEQIKTKARDIIRQCSAHNIIERGFPMAQDILDIIDDDRIDEKTKVDEVYSLMKEVESERFSKISAGMIKQGDIGPTKSEIIVKRIKDYMADAPKLTLATVFSVISALNSYSFLERKDAKAPTLIPLTTTLDNLIKGLKDCNLEELVSGEDYNEMPISSKMLITKIDTLMPLFIDYNAIEQEKLSEFGITTHDTKTSTKFDFQFNDLCKHKQVFKMPLSPFKITYFSHYALGKSINLTLEALKSGQITAGQASEFLTRILSNENVKKLNSQLDSYYRSDPTLEAVFPDDFDSIRQLSLINNDVFDTFSELATKISGQTKTHIRVLDFYVSSIKSRIADAPLTESDINMLSGYINDAFKQYAVLASLKIPSLETRIDGEIQLESEFRQVNDFASKRETGFEQEVANPGIPFVGSANYEVRKLLTPEQARKMGKEKLVIKRHYSSLSDLYADFFIKVIPKETSRSTIGKVQAEDMVDVLNNIHSIAGHDYFVTALYNFVMNRISKKYGKSIINLDDGTKTTGDANIDNMILMAWKDITETPSEEGAYSLTVQLNRYEQHLRGFLEPNIQEQQYKQYHEFKSMLIKKIMGKVFSFVRDPIPGYDDSQFWDRLGIIPETNQLIAEMYDSIASKSEAQKAVTARGSRLTPYNVSDIKASISRVVKSFGTQNIENAFNEAKDNCLETLVYSLESSYKERMKKMPNTVKQFVEIEKIIKQAEYDQMDRIVYVEEKKSTDVKKPALKKKEWVNPEYPGITIADLNKNGFSGLCALAELSFMPVRAYLFPRYKGLMTVDDIVPCYSQIAVKKDPSKPELSEGDLRVNIDLVKNAWGTILDINQDTPKIKMRVV